MRLQIQQAIVMFTGAATVLPMQPTPIRCEAKPRSEEDRERGRNPRLYEEASRQDFES